MDTVPVFYDPVYFNIGHIAIYAFNMCIAAFTR